MRKPRRHDNQLCTMYDVRTTDYGHSGCNTEESPQELSLHFQKRRIHFIHDILYTKKYKDKTGQEKV